MAITLSLLVTDVIKKDGKPVSISSTVSPTLTITPTPNIYAPYDTPDQIPNALSQPEIDTDVRLLFMYHDRPTQTCIYSTIRPDGREREHILTATGEDCNNLTPEDLGLESYYTQDFSDPILATEKYFYFLEIEFPDKSSIEDWKFVLKTQDKRTIVSFPYNTFVYSERNSPYPAVFHYDKTTQFVYITSSVPVGVGGAYNRAGPLYAYDLQNDTLTKVDLDMADDQLYYSPMIDDYFFVGGLGRVKLNREQAQIDRLYSWPPNYQDLDLRPSRNDNYLVLDNYDHEFSFSTIYSLNVTKDELVKLPFYSSEEQTSLLSSEYGFSKYKPVGSGYYRDCVTNNLFIFSSSIIGAGLPKGIKINYVYDFMTQIFYLLPSELGVLSSFIK